MAIQTYTNLRTRAQEIKNETVDEANTALRVGGLMEDKVDTIESGFSTVLPANPDQIINLNGLATKAWDYVYTAGTTMLFDVQRWYGLNPKSIDPEYNKPREYFFDVSRTGAREGNESVMFHSSLIEPERLKPNKPISPLPIYADQAAMLADQVNQVSTEYYYYTGSTSAWLYNGVANGLITDYAELEEIAGWEEWGTKPTWLIITGDAYLVGVDNLNKMTANFYRRYDNAGTTMIDVVVLNIEAYVLGNTDADKEDAYTIILNNFNENDDPVTADSITNESIYTDLFEVTLTMPTNTTPGLTSYVDLGGGNYGLDFGQSRFFSSRATTNMNIGINAKRFLERQEMTIICRTAFRFEDSAQNRAIVNNLTDSVETFQEGFLLEYIEATGAFRLIYASTINTRVSFTSNPVSPIDAVTTGGQYVFMARFWYDVDTVRVRFYVKSSANAIAFQQYGDERISVSVPRLGHSSLIYDRISFNSTSSRPETRDYLQVIMNNITEAELEAIANSID